MKMDLYFNIKSAGAENIQRTPPCLLSILTHFQISLGYVATNPETANTELSIKSQCCRHLSEGLKPFPITHLDRGRGDTSFGTNSRGID